MPNTHMTGMYHLVACKLCSQRILGLLVPYLSKVGIQIPNRVQHVFAKHKAVAHSDITFCTSLRAARKHTSALKRYVSTTGTYYPYLRILKV
jgi:hypothetical protein